MNEERQAQLLAEWLEAPEGTPVPEGLDLDVAETMWVLKPELAPAPRMTSADLLASLDEAPVAAAAAAPAGPPPVVDQGMGEVVDFAAARKKRRLWYGAGVFAAAAMALIVIVPGTGQLENAPMVATPEPTAAFESPELADAGEGLERELAERTVLDELADMVEEAAEEQAPGAEFAQLKPVPQQEPVAAAAPEAPRDLASAKKRASTTATGSTLSLGAPEPEPEPAAAEAELDGAIVADAAMDDFDAAPSARFEGWANDTGLGEAEERAEPAAESKADLSDELSAVAGPSSGSSSVPWPADYSASWYRSALSGDLLAQAEAAFAASDDHQQAGRTDAAVDALVTLLGSGHVHLAQDAAGRAAQLLQQAGRTDEALAMTRRGRGLSSANTAFLSRLWAIEGSIHQARGDLAQATHAYTTAENLNRARDTVSY